MRLVLAAVLTVVVAHAHGQNAPPPCQSSEHRQFDFWIGDWDVFNLEGDKIGENSITLEQGGCVLHEHWAATDGTTGESFNIYDTSRNVWHQSWVSATGNLLLLDGGVVGDNMVISGDKPTADGGRVLNQISYEPQEDGAVHQVWKLSLDGGKTWTTGFHGIYRRKPEAAR